MGIHIFNPPDPTAEPAQPGDRHIGCRPCGNCPSVPRFWSLTALAGPGVIANELVWTGTFRLDRVEPVLPANRDAQCTWNKEISAPGGDEGVWSLWYGTWSGTLTSVGWHAHFNSNTQNFFAHYLIFGNPATGSGQHFNCLKPNTFPPAIEGGFVGGSVAVTVQPFWP